MASFAIINLSSLGKLCLLLDNLIVGNIDLLFQLSNFPPFSIYECKHFILYYLCYSIPLSNSVSK